MPVRINQSPSQQTSIGVPAARVKMSWAAVGVFGQLDPMVGAYAQETYSHATFETHQDLYTHGQSLQLVSSSNSNKSLSSFEHKKFTSAEW